MANVVGINIYIDGVKHNSTPQPLVQQDYNISDVKNPGESFDVQFSYVFDDGTESKLSPMQNLTLLEETVPVGVMNALQGAVTEDGFTVVAKLLENGSATLNVYDDSDRTNLVAQSPSQTADSSLAVKLSVTGLDADTEYFWNIESSGQIAGITGRMKTFPSGQGSYKIITSACASGIPFITSDDPNYRVSDHEVFDGIRLNHSDALMFLHTGDLHYRDIDVNDVNEFYQAFDDVLSTRQQDMFTTLPMAYMWDDHDYGPNNSDSTSNSREASIAAYKKRIPHYPLVQDGVTEPIHQTFVIGRVRYFLLDTRSQRVKGTTFLGAEQKKWLKDTLLESTEPVFCITVSVPWISNSSDDTWYGASDERQEIIDFLVANNLNDKTFLIAGDTHCMAVDDGTNNYGSGIPMIQAASLDSPPSIKGGWYSVGTWALRGQYVAIGIEDNGTTIAMTATGYYYQNGVEYKKFEYTRTFGEDVPDVIKTDWEVIAEEPDNSYMVSKFDFTSRDGNLADTVTGKSYPVPASVVRDGESFFITSSEGIVIPHQDEFTLLDDNDDPIPFTIRVKVQQHGPLSRFMHKSYGSEGNEWSLWHDAADDGLVFRIYDNVGFKESGACNIGRSTGETIVGEAEMVITYDGEEHLRMYRDGIQIDKRAIATSYFEKMQRTNSALQLGGINRDVQFYGLEIHKGIEWTPEQVKGSFEGL